MEIIAVVTGCCGMLHLLVILLQRIRLDNNYNQNISLHGGKAIGENAGTENRLMYVANDENDTTVIECGGFSHVTSSFTSIHIRLYEIRQGRAYDYYLENQLLLGRASGVEGGMLQLSDPMISSRHCRIYRQGEQVLLQDLGSTNHTYLNGCIVEGAMPLSPGDKIQIGRSVFEFQCFI